MSEMVERVARAIYAVAEKFPDYALAQMNGHLADEFARAAIEAQVEWLREFGNHPPAPNCPRCNVADQITAALGEGE